MEFPFKTVRERLLAAALLVLWALLFLPNLRTNPNWYGDEGEWMDASWTLAHGHPRVDAVKNDFLWPYPYPPLYLAVNGTLLRVFGNDIVVGRSLGAAVALGVAAILFWIGCRMRDKNFGFLCAAAFLVYPEAVINFRWARGHTMAGMLVLASVGFLVRYVQEKRLRDILWAGAMASLATATVYWAYPIVGVVIVTALIVNRRHAPAAAVAACAYAILFAVAYGLFRAGGFPELMAQVKRLDPNTSGAPWWAEMVRFYRNVVTFFGLTPTIGPNNTQLVDLWLVGAGAGLIVFPIKRYRGWLVFWMIFATYAVFKGRDNIPIFMYPAMVFLPLLAVPFAGLLVRLGELAERLGAASKVQWAPAAVVLVVFGLISLNGSLGHFRTKIDLWSQHSASDAEAAMEFVNSRTAADDFVIVPKQIGWLVKHARKSMITFSVNYEGQGTDMWPDVIPHDRFWFDCRWRNAKYLVLAYGQDATGRPYGIDAVFTMPMKAVREAITAIQQEKWPVVFRQGEYMVLANPRFVKGQNP